MFLYKVKNMEPFKDGNVLEGRFVKPGEILVVSELDKQRMEQSGALLEVLETLVPNPLKAHIVGKDGPVVVDAKWLGDIVPEETPTLKEVGTEREVSLTTIRVNDPDIQKLIDEGGTVQIGEEVVKLAPKRKAGRPKKVKDA